MAVGGVEGFHLWMREPGQKWADFHHNEGTSNRAVSLAEDNRTLACGSIDGTISLWDIPARKTVKTLKGFDDDVAPSAFLPTCRTWLVRPSGVCSRSGT